MDTTIIQVNYEQLTEISQRFLVHADIYQQLLTRIQKEKDVLQNGGWKGNAAIAFFEELDCMVIPGITRLQNALEISAKTVLEITEIMRRAEEDAARLFTASTESSSTTTGYIRPENINNTSNERLSDLKAILQKTQGGQEVLNWLNQYGVDVSFGDAGEAIAYCTPNGKKIVLGEKYAYLSDYELAAILVHEGTHSLDSHPFDVPFIGPLMNAWYNVQDNFMYAAYPFPEEYRAFRAQAQFWKEIKAKEHLESSQILDGTVNLIFDADNNYRDIDAVYKELHNSYRYSGIINP